MVEGAPAVLKEGVSKEEGEELRRKFLKKLVLQLLLSNFLKGSRFFYNRLKKLADGSWESHQPFCVNRNSARFLFA